MRLGARTIATLAGAVLLVPSLLLRADDTAKPSARAMEDKAVTSRVVPGAVPKARQAAAMPAPAPVPPSSDTYSYTPKVDLFLGYSGIRAVPTNTLGNRIVWLSGASGSIAFNLNRYLGLVADFGGYHDTRLRLTGTGANPPRSVTSTGTVFTYLFGPRLSYRSDSRFTPFVQALFGDMHASQVTITGCTGVGCTPLRTEDAFAMAAGGGLDLRVHDHIALRLIQAEYLMTRFGDQNTGVRTTQNDMRVSTGIVFNFGGEPPPVLAPPTPSLSCSADATAVAPGTMVHFTGTVSPTGYPYTYTWTSTGGKLEQSQNTATLDTTGLAPGVYTVSSHVDNGQGGFADCKTDVELREPVKNPPTVTASADPSSLLPGAASTLTAVCSSPDQRPLTLGWTVTGGKLDSNNQAVVHLDTTDVAPGTITGTVTCTDDRGLSATADTTVTVEAPAAPPPATLATTIAFKTNSARVDNVAKAALDDVALRLQQDPNAKAVIVGFSDSSERNADMLAKQRAVNAKAYLTTEKGIAADRIEVRSDTTTGGTKAEVWIVPQGATYSGSAQPFDESSVKPMVAHHAARRHHVRHHAAKTAQ